MKQYSIWTIKPYTGDKLDCIAQYTNRGHAVAKLRGLQLASWKARSETQYTLQDDGPNGGKR